MARKRKTPAITPHVAAEAPPAALADMMANATKPDDSGFVEPLPETAIFQLQRLASEAALAMLARTMNDNSRRQDFRLRQIERAIADLGLQTTGPDVPFRQGMQTMIDALPGLYEIARMRMKDHPPRSHLETLLAEARQYKDAADVEFRRKRQRGGEGGDPQATMRAARRREPKPKA